MLMEPPRKLFAYTRVATSTRSRHTAGIGFAGTTQFMQQRFALRSLESLFLELTGTAGEKPAAVMA
jgi:hypothetical protein